MSANRSSRRKLLGATALAGALSMFSAVAWAQDAQIQFDQPQQPLAQALRAFSAKADREIMFADALVAGRTAPALKGAYTPDTALVALLDGTGLTVSRTASGVLLVQRASDPQSGSAAGDGADSGTVQALIVTAQKREENIQDVPIAMSAFTQEDLTRSQVATGADLMTQVPNMTFTKTNFTGYSIQLRGIGTQAISATVDPAVAVAFNNTPFIRNRFFEQEFYDLQRIEVLRGPQGTLYGRNATAGVVNLISAKPKFSYEAKLSADIGNYNSSRLEGMVNVPLVEDKVALRIAGAWTKRDGYDVNQVNGNRIDGRDLWSTRVSLRFAPTDKIDANLIWEHFNENDDRIRSGKQLCKTDVVTSVAGIPTPDFYQPLRNTGQDSAWDNVQSGFSQGCLPASLYSQDSFGKTNALALPYYVPLGALQLPIATSTNATFGVPADPYATRTQSTDLRTIEAAVDPTYRAKTDIAELQFRIDLTDHLTLNSETGWGSDFIFSTQDYNRFAGAPHAWRINSPDPYDISHIYQARGILNDQGQFCDPQIGCSDRLVAMDLSTAHSRQFSQELRLASNFEGPFNFSLGANFLRYDTEDKYYVFINSISMLSAYLINGLSAPPIVPYIPNVTDNAACLPHGMIGPDYNRVQPIAACTYIDPNPVTSLNDLGHNYFLSKNPFKLISYAMFGEAYYNLTPDIKLTAGVRWTVDKKEAPEIPSWIFAAGTVGYPVIDTVRQEWREPTGRLAMDWKPDLSFTDQTLVYGSYSHGYKAGGMNPPPYGKTMYAPELQGDLGDALTRASALHPKTFEPEFVNAFEIGAKNTLLDGKLVLNLASFYYDYKGYQLSQIVDRSAVTHNYDAKIFGVELESDWRPIENLRLGTKLGFEKTRVANGMQAIDVMDRTAGHTDWVVERPFPSLPTNCVLPTWLFVGDDPFTPQNPDVVDTGGKAGGNPGGCEEAYLLGNDPVTSAPFQLNGGAPWRQNVNYAAYSQDRADYPCLPAGIDPKTMTQYPGVDPQCLIAASNNGEGFFKNLAGKELPNAPHITATITADYTIPLQSDWLVTLHADLYYQSEAWARIFNTPGYDKLKAYNNVNLAAIFTNEDAGWKIMAYVKNVLDKTNITGAFLNSDDSGLTTNVFLNEPRLYGLRVTKEWNGGPWWTGANLNHTGPYPLTVEIGGQIQRQTAGFEPLRPSWMATRLPQVKTPDSLQQRDLDTGDERSVMVTYRPEGSRWNVSAGYRYGDANIGTGRFHADLQNVLDICAFNNPFYITNVCTPGAPYYNVFPQFHTVNANYQSDTAVRSHEEHGIADLAVGADMGRLPGSISSELGFGLRYASFRSNANWVGDTLGDWIVPLGWYLDYSAPLSYNPSSNHRLSANLQAERTFKGAGPTVSWNAAAPLLGNEEVGRVKLNWSVTGGVLFGDQNASVTGQEKDIFQQGRIIPLGGSDALPQFGDPIVTPVRISRSHSKSVPLVDLSLGLSYDIQRVKVSTGYHWERYFNAIDGGYTEHRSYDRTFDGPYFKIAVGFGG